MTKSQRSGVAVALTGAGISKSSGIPTFQESPGISAKLSVDYKRAHPDEFRATIEQLKANCSGKEPSSAHIALARAHIPVITMNVDGLHQAAGSQFVLEIHGSFARDDVVLYGQQLRHADDSVRLITTLGTFVEQRGLNGYFLIIGSSMGTYFANYLEHVAERCGLTVETINDNADAGVPLFINSMLNLESQKLFRSEITFIE